MKFHPDQNLRCLLIQPKFSETNYWNFVEGARAIGAKATAPPLGLMTVAAILPENWEYRLIDLNVVDRVQASDWEWCDLVCTGGMLPQQLGIQAIIAECNSRDIFVAVGGPDPTSQPQLYTDADARVLGEGESSIPNWLQSWRAGQPNGQFEQTETPDVEQSPIPKFELIRFEDYLHVGLQSSRGCPYNCEFCDIIELFGRKPRVKSPEKFEAELDHLRKLGYRGWVDITDDNFIGNRLKIKPVLERVAKWSKERGYPFFFSTEASVNLADDDELLELMRDCQFRYVFLGIETPNADVLAQTQKRINTVKPLTERVRKIYGAGISITAGFILGFDSEPEDCAEGLTQFIEESGIMLAMVGLLTALPNTQLTRRLAREGRLIDHDHQWQTDPNQLYELISNDVDQLVGGLNFVTVRNRVEIYRDLRNVLLQIYSPKSFFGRVLSTTQRLGKRHTRVPGVWESKRLFLGFVRVASKMLMHPKTRWYYIRNSFRTLLMGPAKFEFAQTLMGAYLHFHDQTELVAKQLEDAIRNAESQQNYPLQVADMPEKSLPILSAASCGSEVPGHVGHES